MSQIASYKLCIHKFNMLSNILISDLLVADLFKHSLTGMSLLYLAIPVLNRIYFCMRCNFTNTYIDYAIIDHIMIIHVARSS